MSTHRRPRQPRRRRFPRLDVISILVAPLGIAMVAAAHALDGSNLSGLLQTSSALVVFGGTLGAILISYSPVEVVKAGIAAAQAFRAKESDETRLGAMIVTLSIRAHRHGNMALESELDHIGDPLLKNGLSLVVDDGSLEALEELMSLENRVQDADDDVPARIFEAAAGYAPTMGILGAVLGLMRVMEH